MNIIKPKALAHGATLGIIATGNPITLSSDATISRAYDYLRNKGFNIVEAECCRKNAGHTAGTIRERVEDLHKFFLDPDIDAIVTYWGGYNTHQILEYLDFDTIKNNPKILLGYSDVTSLQIAIFKETGLITFSGPAGITFGKPEVPDFTWEHLEKVIINPLDSFTIGKSDTFSDNKCWEDPAQKMHFQKTPDWKIFREGTAQGRILAGNAGTMLLLAGTKFWPDFDTCILFLEEDEIETSRTIDRMFTQLRQIGVFNKISGLIIGRFSSQVSFNNNDSLEMILEDALRGYHFPVITGVDFGHTDPLITIPNGIMCDIDTADIKISFLERAVIVSENQNSETIED
jgi:muramoyltetrapeptide carboxypeptidase